ncbi:nicotinamide mononucleotide transporter PnuC [Iocasia frigidifontis]|uniref:Nicotinamide mononucleotide transporter PnuC n=1 Tax=Iocasia fonsfrigidae TaxID=2682810 RepID=A0A8A7KM03_9FIRM|nr:MULTISPECIES: nicotinamide riboside transporter PnuC [Halanaerobiaceae]AZO96356.1 nicotinamide mononucleotide transporter PnuC [Halocella sp. SP3-1]QTL99114.1 nicotinamide mononucleotide transporter PnuC [Iocasia fonsfrigidae]
MEKIKNYFSDWSIYEELWLALVCTIMISVWYLNGDTPFMLILSLTGSLNLVLGAKGKVTGLYFAVINSLLYSYQCMGVKLYGEVMYNLIYSIPVSIIAIYLWKKNTKSNGQVCFRTMTPKLMVMIFIGTVAGIFGYSGILKVMGGNLPFMDSLTTVVSVIASILYLMRFSEQWLMWVVVNALSIAMWIMVYMSGDKTALIIIVMKITNLLNSSYGYYNWKKIALNKKYATT